MDFNKQFSDLRRQQERAQKLVFEKYGKLMYALCRRYISPAEEAEEVMMNGFMKVFTKVKDASFNNELAFAGWIKRIMVNECLQHLRKTHSFLVMADAPESEGAELVLADRVLEAKELFTMIESLPAGYRTVFNLYVIEGFTHREIAAMMAISEGASKSQLSKARVKLAQLWKQKNEYYGLGKAR